MTEIETQNFISQVLQGFWPEWTPTNAEYKVWIRKLQGYHYSKSEKALGEWLSEQEVQGKSPKMGKIFKALSARRTFEIKPKPESIKVFELFDQDNPRKRQPFFVGSEKELRNRTDQSYESEAEHKRNIFNTLYGGNWVVIQDWKKYFTESEMAIC
jgi:hypothetical protein